MQSRTIIVRLSLFNPFYTFALFMEKLLNCPICESNQLATFIKAKDYTVSNDYFTINQCIKCKFKFTNPRPSLNEISPYYLSENYISHSDTSKGFVNSLYKIVRQYTINQKVRLINNYVPKGSSVMDYGAGTGAFLYALSKSGFSTIGVEPSEQARAKAYSEYGIELIGVDNLQQFDKQSINCITLWHVLEHVHSLKETLGAFHSLLTSNGYLIIAVPNADSFDANHYKKYWAAYDVPRHLYHFNIATMKTLMSSANFVHLKTIPMPFDSTYVSILSEKYIAQEGVVKNSVKEIVKGVFWGLSSNLKGIGDIKNFSSLIYIFRKAT